MVKLVIDGLVLADSTGQGKTDFQETRSVLDNKEVFHIISPSSSLSSPGKAPKQLSLAHALAVENDTRLRQALEENRIMKVVFINASDSVMSKKKQQQYRQMKLYREALQLPETDFTIMSLRSLVCFFGLFCVFSVFIAGFSVLCEILIRKISCACSTILDTN